MSRNDVTVFVNITIIPVIIIINNIFLEELNVYKSCLR
jgi:hypothetical protein